MSAGQWHAVEGRREAAQEYLSKAAKLDPRLVSAWNTLGTLCEHRGDPRAALACFDAAIEFSRVSGTLRDKGQTEHRDVSEESEELCLSHVLRAKALRSARLGLGVTGLRGVRNARKSVEAAKEALRVGAQGKHGLKNGELWFSLANAFVALFAREAALLCDLSLSSLTPSSLHTLSLTLKPLTLTPKARQRDQRREGVKRKRKVK